MNLATAITELKARGFSYLSDARATIMLNAAKNDLEDVYPFPWLVTTTTGTAPLTISDLKYVLYVEDTTNKNVLWGMNAEDIVSQQYYDITLSGIPEIFWLDGLTTLKVWPTNTSASLSARYVKYSPELTGTDTPLIPTRYHPLWIDLATVRGYKDADDLDRAGGLMRDCQSQLGALIEEMGSMQRANPDIQQIRSGAGDW